MRLKIYQESAKLQIIVISKKKTLISKQVYKIFEQRNCSFLNKTIESMRQRVSTYLIEASNGSMKESVLFYLSGCN